MSVPSPAPRMLTPGDPVPTLYGRTSGNPRYALDSAAGRTLAICFIGSSSAPGMRDWLGRLYATAAPFDDEAASCFIVSSDPADEAEGRLADRYPGIRVLWDMDGALASAFGCLRTGDGGVQLACATFILDRALRVAEVLPIDRTTDHFAAMAAAITRLPSPASDREGTAPVLVVPSLIEPQLARDYIAYARAAGLEESGFMQTDHATGQTGLVVDHRHKRRSDCTIEDAALRDALRARIVRRLVPQVQRAFQFEATRIERYIVAAYDSADGGWFRPHRDNTTLGTAHRRFAVSINLNADDYEGGDLRFPEFGRRTYRAPTGGAVVFSCSLLHEATPITSGVRYCILPFLYDEAGAATRLANAQHLADPKMRDGVLASVSTPKG
ncbi:MAG: 2OG-Fe(II) oxygenase [Sphingobium sp.]